MDMLFRRFLPYTYQLIIRRFTVIQTSWSITIIQILGSWGTRKEMDYHHNPFIRRVTALKTSWTTIIIHLLGGSRHSKRPGLPPLSIYLESHGTRNDLDYHHNPFIWRVTALETTWTTTIIHL